MPCIYGSKLALIRIYKTYTYDWKTCVTANILSVFYEKKLSYKYKTLRNLVMHDMIKKNSLGIVDFCFVNNGLAHNFGNEVIERLD